MAIGTYAQDNAAQAEVAFVVREDFQGMGIASYLLETLEEIAIENKYSAFVATVLPENKAMLQIFRRRYPGASFTRTGGNEVGVVMPFASDVGGPGGGGAESDQGGAADTDA